jgi:tape measure domain-containing protein
MASIKSAIELQDKMTPVLKNVVTALDSTINALGMVDGASSEAFKQAQRDVRAATTAVNEYEQQLNQSSIAADKAAESVNKTATSVEKTNKSLNSMNAPLLNISAAIYTIKSALQSLSKITGVSDEFVLSTARLDLMNDGLQTTKQLQDKIFESAARSRGSYSDTAVSIAKLGITAGENFNSSAEIVAFTELMSKSFKVGGASQQEQSAGMYQLTQAMAAGKLQGDEFRSIMENAPMLAAAIAEYTGKSKGELKEMSAEGKITADIIKSALFSAADDINSKFEKLPKTFGDVAIYIQNRAIQIFDPVMTRLNEIINSDEFNAFIEEVLIPGIQLLANGVLWLFDIIESIMDFVADNYPMVIAGLIAVGAVIAFLTIQTWLMNAAWLANPVVWIIIGIIAAIILLIKILKDLGVTNEQIMSGIGAVIGGVFGFAYNQIAMLWNGFASFAEFIANLFIDPVYAIKKLFWDLAMSTLETLKSLFGWIGGYGDMLQMEIDLLNKIKPTSDKKVVSIERMEQVNLNEAWNKGAQMGSDISNTLDNLGKQLNNFNLDNYKPDGGMLDSIGKIDSDVTISDEDIKLLKDVAATEFVNRYTTMRPEMHVTFGDVRETADIEEILDTLETMVEEAYASSMSGGN